LPGPAFQKVKSLPAESKAWSKDPGRVRVHHRPGGLEPRGPCSRRHLPRRETTGHNFLLATPRVNPYSFAGCYSACMLRTGFLIGIGLLTMAVAAFGEQRMISVGDRRFAVYCDGEPAHLPTVVLIPAGGRTANDWAKVQPVVSSCARVWTYDHANFGESDKAPVTLQSVDEIVEDLHGWLKASGEKAPFILVSHSNAGFYARRFVTGYPHETAGLVFVDSSHEEQALRLHELDPRGPGLDDLTARLGFFVKAGERLEWRTELPLIVIGRGMPTPRKARDGSESQANRMTEEQCAAWDLTWYGQTQDTPAGFPCSRRRGRQPSRYVRWRVTIRVRPPAR
jgi:pimeloyl-ACP methyl ester carboxylesterase